MFWQKLFVLSAGKKGSLMEEEVTVEVEMFL